MFRFLVYVFVIAALGACATPITVFEAGTPCEARSFTVTDGFGGARRGRCEVLARNHVRLTILPEDEGYINPSPWYAFRLLPSTDTTAIVSLQYVGGRHRYVPKTSTDIRSWTPLEPGSVQVAEDETVVRLEIPLGPDPVYVSAQELIPPTLFGRWAQFLADRGPGDVKLLGYSGAEHPIIYIDSDAPSNDVVLLVGRQHPPEVSGSFAFFSFVETLLANTDLGARFREQFRIIAIPLLNPDGVLRGNWRHNLGGADLNRDWGIFEQPETRLVGDLLDKLDADGDRLRVFLDFHSTDRNLFYTQDETVPTDPPRFFESWFAAAEPRLSNYPFTNEAGPGKHPAVAKNYIYTRYGIPAATYEVGDEMDRDAARAAAVVFAEEFMRLMLETLAPAP